MELKEREEYIVSECVSAHRAQQISASIESRSRVDLRSLRSAKEGHWREPRREAARWRPTWTSFMELRFV